MGFSIVHQIIPAFSVFDSNLFGSSLSVLNYLSHLPLRLVFRSYCRSLVHTPTGFQTLSLLTSFISYIPLGYSPQIYFFVFIYLSSSSPSINFWHLLFFLY
jgi:hypothetical protein